MDLAFSAEHERFRAELRKWLADHLKRPWIEDLRDPEQDPDALFGIRRRWQKALDEASYLGMDWPEAWGGRGATAVEKAILAEELFRADAPPIPNVLGISLLGPALIHHGTEEQRQRFLPKMLAADEIWCQGFSEPDAGSDLAALRMRAEPDGENFRLTGQKVWTTLGPWADWIFALARTDSNDRYGGITFFLVPLHQDGVEVRPIRQITGEGEFGEVFFDGALARREHVVGKLGEGWRIAMTVLAYERGAMSLAYPAQYDRYLEDLLEGVRANGTFEHADVREALARLLVENEVLRSNGLRNLATLASGRAPGPEASIEKIFWSEYARRLTDTAVDLLGPEATLRARAPHARPHMDWAYEVMWSRAGTIYAGSSEIQRNIIAKRVLKLPTN